MPSPARRVALLCLDLWREVDANDHRPFNYAVRRIQAAILGHAELSKRVEVKLIEATSFDMDDFLGRIRDFDPDFIGVSAYVWSFPLLLEVCRRAKRERPDRTIVFGGPSARPEMFELPQHADASEVVDAICVGEGEDLIQEMLLGPDQSRDTLMKLRGLAVHKDGRWNHTGERVLGPPDVHPSPYTLDLMPHGVTAVLESFRGCPLSCTFCEWGDTGVKARSFGVEYMVRELNYLRATNAHGAWLVSPGLNLHGPAFKALAKAEAETHALRDIGMFRCEIYPSHMTEDHLRFLDDIKAKYAGIGLQSLDPDTLKGVERPFSEDKFNRVVKDVSDVVPDTVVEIILGLPGDTPATFMRTLDTVRKLPVSIRVFHCLVLPSALMTRAPAAFQLEFDPYTLQVMSNNTWSRKDLENMRGWLTDNAYHEDADIAHGGTWKFWRADRPETKPAPKWEPGTTPPRETPPWLRDAEREGQGRIPEVRPPSSEASGTVTGAPAKTGKSDSFSKLPPGKSIVPQALFHMLQRQVRDAGPWKLNQVIQFDDTLSHGIVAYIGRTDRPEGAGNGSFRLTIAREELVPQRYRAANGIAYAYETDATGNAPAVELDLLDRLLAKLQPIMRVVIFGMKLDRRPTLNVV